MSNQKHISIRLPSDLEASIAAVAEHELTSSAAVIRRAVVEWMRREARGSNFMDWQTEANRFIDQLENDRAEDPKAFIGTPKEPGRGWVMATQARQALDALRERLNQFSGRP